MYFIFSTKNNNYYMYDSDKKKFIIIPTGMHFSYGLLEENGFDYEKCIRIVKDKKYIILDDKKIKKGDVLYYLKKVKFLKENGLFSETEFTRKRFGGKLTGESVKYNIANTKQVTFEITERCNLNCKYCAYGEFYNDYDKRERKDLEVKKARLFLNYMRELWNSSLNSSQDNNVYISFYGGEPLLNFPFIKEIVKFVKELDLQHNRFTFSMTTNGVLIEKYMDFLVENKFNLLISLDGNRENNSYRVFKDGKPSYSHVLKSVLALKNKYPEYFKNRVNFNTVLHNKNSVSDIHKYFKQMFDKKSSIGELNNVGIREDKKKEFIKTYSNIYESLHTSEDYTYIQKDMFIKLPDIQNLSTFLLKYSDSSFDNYNEFFIEDENVSYVPTGTCLPFSKKVFITAKGKILPCERVSHKYGLGYLTHGKVEIDFERIAEKYNNYYDKMKKECDKCYNRIHCMQCIFQLDIDSENPKCYGFMSKQDYKKYLANYMGFLEDKPENYSRIMKEIVIEY